MHCVKLAKSVLRADVTTLDGELERGENHKVNHSWVSKSDSLSSCIANYSELTTGSEPRAKGERCTRSSKWSKNCPRQKEMCVALQGKVMSVRYLDVWTLFPCLPALSLGV
jgi:hypothetical protein